jgi:transcriptional regulator with XRE-family HTH domain
MCYLNTNYQNLIFRGDYMESNFNQHLGSKLRMRRLALGLTQTKVAQAINVTFQQIQKYEKGTNGISSLRIMQLANFLKVPVVYFYEDFSTYEGETYKTQTIENLNYSFLTKLFSNLSPDQKEKISQVLRNTGALDKTGT